MDSKECLDFYAGMALSGILSSGRGILTQGGTEIVDYDVMARVSFDVAYAMIAERKKRNV